MSETIATKCPEVGCTFGGTDAELALHKFRMGVHDLHARQISNDPKPFCIGCIRVPDEIYEYQSSANEMGVSPDAYVKQEEGTYNPKNGHFLCTKCYIGAGSPTSPEGWKAP